MKPLRDPPGLTLKRLTLEAVHIAVSHMEPLFILQLVDPVRQLLILDAQHLLPDAPCLARYAVIRLLAALPLAVHFPDKAGDPVLLR